MRLAITNLEVSFGERRVVDLAELAVGEAEIVGLAGASGSGKSMTALAVLGLAHTVGARVSGSIRLDGAELTGLSHREMREVRGRRIAAIFQSPALAFSPVYRVGSIVHRALRLHGMTRAEASGAAERAMRQVLLPPGLLGRYPSQLSGGQLQRVAIALALALRAEVLLADEPTSALDVTVQAEGLELLRELRDRERMSVLFISHDLAVVAELCDRVATMQHGSIRQQGATSQVITAPASPPTARLLAAGAPRAGGAGRGGAPPAGGRRRGGGPKAGPTGRSRDPSAGGRCPRCDRPTGGRRPAGDAPAGGRGPGRAAAAGGHRSGGPVRARPGGRRGEPAAPPPAPRA